MENNFKVNNDMVSFDDFLRDDETAHLENVKTAILDRISSNFTTKGIIGPEKEKLLQSIKVAMQKIDTEKYEAGIDAVFRKDKPENCLFHEDDDISIGFEKNPVQGKRPYVLWINIKPPRKAKFTNFIANRIKTCTAEMISELFHAIPEEWNEIGIHISTDPKPVIVASRTTTGGRFLWQDVTTGKFKPLSPIAYMINNHVWMSIPEESKPREFVFHFPM